MSKKKVNPNRIPISADSFDINQITAEAINDMTLKAWALVLGSLADFHGITSEVLLYLWKSVNFVSSRVRVIDDISEELKLVEKVAGISLPFEHISSENIKTQGDLDKFTRKTYQNALYAAFALIGSPIIREELLPEEDIVLVFRKAYSMNEEIERGKKGRVSIADIQEMLEDEFGLLLFEHNGDVLLIKQEELISRTAEPL